MVESTGVGNFSIEFSEVGRFMLKSNTPSESYPTPKQLTALDIKCTKWASETHSYVKAVGKIIIDSK